MQMILLLLTGLSVWLITTHRTTTGYAVGLLAQPFWLYVTWTAGQWGMFAVALWITYSYVAALAPTAWVWYLWYVSYLDLEPVKVWYLKFSSKRRQRKVVDRCVENICAGILTVCLLVIASGQSINRPIPPGLPSDSIYMASVVESTRDSLARYENKVIDEMIVNSIKLPG